jgi:hypothetical protein
MLYGTLCKIKTKDEEDGGELTPGEEENAILPSLFTLNTPAIKSKETFIPLSKRSFNSQSAAMFSLSKLVSHPYYLANKGGVGMLLHPSVDLAETQRVELLRLTGAGKISHVTIENPFWTGLTPPKRNLKTHTLHTAVSGAMQSQLFAMLEGSGGDSRWMARYTLEDPQVDEVYHFQREILPTENCAGKDELITLMKNVLNYVKLPWIILEFKAEGKACFFSIQVKGAEAITPDKDDGSEEELGAWSWLHDLDNDNYETIGEKPPEPISIGGMRLVIIAEWAMNPYVLLHELAHYITFCLPTPYQLNKGEETLSFNQYEQIFSSHGTLYCSVFAHLLTKFMYVDPDWLYETLTDQKIDFFPIKRFDTPQITRDLTQYIKNS